jgi:hypothetical protein
MMAGTVDDEGRLRKYIELLLRKANLKPGSFAWRNRLESYLALSRELREIGYDDEDLKDFITWFTARNIQSYNFNLIIGLIRRAREFERKAQLQEIETKSFQVVADAWDRLPDNTRALIAKVAQDAVSD